MRGAWMQPSHWQSDDCAVSLQWHDPIRPVGGWIRVLSAAIEMEMVGLCELRHVVGNGMCGRKAIKLSDVQRCRTVESALDLFQSFACERVSVGKRVSTRTRLLNIPASCFRFVSACLSPLESCSLAPSTIPELHLSTVRRATLGRAAATAAAEARRGGLTTDVTGRRYTQQKQEPLRK